MWSWPGAVALVLAVCIGVGWATAVILLAARPDPGGIGATVLYTLGGALVGGLVTFLTTHRKAYDDEREP